MHDEFGFSFNKYTTVSPAVDCSYSTYRVVTINEVEQKDILIKELQMATVKGQVKG